MPGESSAMAPRMLLVVVLAAASVGPLPAGAEVPNDDYAHAVVFTDLPFLTQVDTSEAKTEPFVGSPLGGPCGWGMQHSVWYRFEPAQDAQTVIRAAGAGFDASIAVFVGDDQLSLRGVACSSGFESRPAEVDLGVAAGTAYSIVVGGRGSAIQGDEAFGELDLSVTEIDGPVRYRPPLNDHRSDATVIEALPFQDTVYAHSAGHDVEDPVWFGLPMGLLEEMGNSGNVWYRFTPSEDTTVRITAERRYPEFWLDLYEEVEGRPRFMAEGGEFFHARIIMMTLRAGHSYAIEVTATFQEDDDPVRVSVEVPGASDLVVDWVRGSRDDLGLYSVAFGWYFDGPPSGAGWFIEACPLPAGTGECSMLDSGTSMDFLDWNAESGPLLGCIGDVDIKVTAIGLYKDPNLANNVRRERAAMNGGGTGLDAGACAPGGYDLRRPLLP